MLIYHIFVDFGDGTSNYLASASHQKIANLFRFGTSSYDVTTWVSYK